MILSENLHPTTNVSYARAPSASAAWSMSGSTYPNDVPLASGKTKRAPGEMQSVSALPSRREDGRRGEREHALGAEEVEQLAEVVHQPGDLHPLGLAVPTDSFGCLEEMLNLRELSLTNICASVTETQLKVS